MRNVSYLGSKIMIPALFAGRRCPMYVMVISVEILENNLGNSTK
jgi:hypothetical protein